MRRARAWAPAAVLAVALVSPPLAVAEEAPPTMELPEDEASAGTGRAVTLDDVLAGIDGRHPLLDAAAQERPIAEGDLQSSEGAFDVAWRTRGTAVPLGGYPSGRIDSVFEVPTPWWGLTMFAGYRWGSDTFADYDGKLETNEFGEVRAGALVPLWRNGPIDRRRANIERAEIGLGLAELSIAERQIELARLASIRYWEWVGAGRRLALAREVLAAAKERDQGIAARVASGDLPEIEHVDNQRAILQRRQQVVAAERSLAQAAFELSLYHRTKSGVPIVLGEAELPSGLPDPSAPVTVSERTIDDAVGRRPEVARLRGQREQAVVEREWAGNQRAPAIDLAVIGSQDLGDGNPKRDPFELEASLLLDIPIERNVADGRVKAADAQIARAESLERFALDRVQTELRDASSAIQAAIERTRIAREELAFARRLEQGERDKFALGDSSLLLVNLREQATLEAGVREVDALVDYHRSRAAFEAATGLRAAPAKVAPRGR